MAEQTQTLKLAADRDVAQPRQHLVSAFLDDDLDCRLTALSPTRSLAGTSEFRAVVEGLIARLGSANPSRANRALLALASLGPPAVPHLLGHLKAGLESLIHRRLVTALAVAALHADPEMHSAVRAALASSACEANNLSPLWIASRGALAWLDEQTGLGPNPPST